LIGEIRDPETAHMALRAAMTGHRVFTTLHTQGALSAIYRLLELGLRPSFLAGHLSGIIAQRLVRQLCHACKDPVQVPFLFQRPVLRPQMIFQAKGCPACEGSGYRGRVPLAEVLLFDEQMHTWLFKGAPREQGPERLKTQQFRSLWEEGLSRVLRGQTDVAEIERVLGAPPFPLSNKDEGCHGGAF
jgi:type II secretory ATPase GspE/PulE/Tfp pilus assembly ATPase PilB-like protein